MQIDNGQAIYDRRSISDGARCKDGLDVAKSDGMGILCSGTFSILYHDPQSLSHVLST